MASEHNSYTGQELTLFAEATNWASYVYAQLKPHLHGVVLEVGAGLGTRTRALAPSATRWISIEPDASMGSTLKEDAAKGLFGGNVEIVHGTLKDAPPGLLADVILYVDVLEHIEADREELVLAASRLNPGGRIVVLSPAHQWLFTPFDSAIGHHRRYTLKSLQAIKPGALSPVTRRMLDSVGLLASTANRFLLKSAMPTRSQVLVWDRMMVPVSRWLDVVTGHLIGKSVLVVWEKK